MQFFTKILMIQNRQSAGFNMVDMCMVWSRGGGIPQYMQTVIHLYLGIHLKGVKSLTNLYLAATRIISLHV